MVLGHLLAVFSDEGDVVVSLAAQVREPLIGLPECELVQIGEHFLVWSYGLDSKSIVKVSNDQCSKNRTHEVY